MRLIRHRVDGDARLAIGVGEVAIDVAALGRPGLLRQPPRFLKDGDEVVVDIEGIGRLGNRCRVLRD